MGATDSAQIRSRQSVTIGVTGHRFLCKVEELIPRIDAALDHIETEWPGASLTIMSALAEGSDRLVVHRALSRSGIRLVVPLPMPETEYMQDFQLAGSSQEFLQLLACADIVVRFPSAPARPKAYEAAGHYMLSHCDLLIALWDGAPAQGDGGTGRIVGLARRQGIPLVWIHTHNCRPGHQSAPGSTAQGAVTFERF